MASRKAQYAHNVLKRSSSYLNGGKGGRPSHFNPSKNLLDPVNPVAKNPLVNQLLAVQEISAADMTSVNLATVDLIGQDYEKFLQDPLTTMLMDLSPLLSRQLNLTALDLKFEHKDPLYSDQKSLFEYLDTNPDPNLVTAFLLKKIKRDDFTQNSMIRDKQFLNCLEYIHGKIASGEYNCLNSYLMCKSMGQIKTTGASSFHENLSKFPKIIDEKFLTVIKNLKINLKDYGFDDLLQNSNLLKFEKNQNIIRNRYKMNNISSRSGSKTVHEYQTTLFKNYCLPKWTEEKNASQLESLNYRFRTFKNLPMNYMEFQNLAVWEMKCKGPNTNKKVKLKDRQNRDRKPLMGAQTERETKTIDTKLRKHARGAKQR